jgi:UPF0755 protein
MPDTPSTDDHGAQPLSRRAAREARAADESRTAPAAETEPATGMPQPTPSRPAEPIRPAASRPAASRPAAASLDALFEDQAANAPAAAKRHARDRKKSKVAAWTVFGVVLAFIGALVVGGFWVWTTYED